MITGNFKFPEPWQTVEYDAEGGFHRRHIEKCQGIKGVDYLATTGEQMLWLEETDFGTDTLADRHSLAPRYRDDLLNGLKPCREKSVTLSECARLNEVKWLPHKMFLGDEFAEKVCGTVFGLSIAAQRDDIPELRPYVVGLSDRVPVTAILCILNPPRPNEFRGLATSLKSKIEQRINTKIHKGLGFDNFQVMVVNQDTLHDVLPILSLQQHVTLT